MPAACKEGIYRCRLSANQTGPGTTPPPRTRSNNSEPETKRPGDNGVESGKQPRSGQPTITHLAALSSRPGTAPRRRRANSSTSSSRAHSWPAQATWGWPPTDRRRRPLFSFNTHCRLDIGNWPIECNCDTASQISATRKLRGAAPLRRAQRNKDLKFSNVLQLRSTIDIRVRPNRESPLGTRKTFVSDPTSHNPYGIVPTVAQSRECQDRSRLAASPHIPRCHTVPFTRSSSCPAHRATIGARRPYEHYTRPAGRTSSHRRIGGDDRDGHRGIDDGLIHNRTLRPAGLAATNAWSTARGAHRNVAARGGGTTPYNRSPGGKRSYRRVAKGRALFAAWRTAARMPSAGRGPPLRNARAAMQKRMFGIGGVGEMRIRRRLSWGCRDYGSVRSGCSAEPGRFMPDRYSVAVESMRWRAAAAAAPATMGMEMAGSGRGEDAARSRRSSAPNTWTAPARRRRARRWIFDVGEGPRTPAGTLEREPLPRRRVRRHWPLPPR